MFKSRVIDKTISEHREILQMKRIKWKPKCH